MRGDRYRLRPSDDRSAGRTARILMDCGLWMWDLRNFCCCKIRLKIVKIMKSNKSARKLFVRRGWAGLHWLYYSRDILRLWLVGLRCWKKSYLLTLTVYAVLSDLPYPTVFLSSLHQSYRIQHYSNARSSPSDDCRDGSEEVLCTPEDRGQVTRG